MNQLKACRYNIFFSNVTQVQGRDRSFIYFFLQKKPMASIFTGTYFGVL